MQQFSDDFLERWEHIIDEVNKTDIPLECIKKIIVKLNGKRQKTINIERLLDQGVEPDEIEDAISRQLMKLDDEVVGIEFILNVKSIADAVQPETDNLLRGL